MNTFALSHGGAEGRIQVFVISWVGFPAQRFERICALCLKDARDRVRVFCNSSLMADLISLESPAKRVFLVDILIPLLCF